jgi:large subunit ribosomal protein L23
MPAHVDAAYVLKRPVLSEKSTWAMNEQNRYAFVVDARATKDEIKAAIEKLYKVRVEGINTQRRKHKAKRFRTGVVIPSDTKKAIVKLHKDDKLEVF